MEKKTQEVYCLFVKEMHTVKSVISRKSKPQTFAQPKYAGAGHWARFLQRRLEKQMMVVCLFEHSSFPADNDHIGFD